jgi:hypothetical protein
VRPEVLANVVDDVPDLGLLERHGRDAALPVMRPRGLPATSPAVQVPAGLTRAETQSATSTSALDGHPDAAASTCAAGRPESLCQFRALCCKALDEDADRGSRPRPP